MATVNHERMPVLLTREQDFSAWLEASPKESLSVAREYPPGLMRIVRAGMERKDVLEEAIA